jgi:hypothetical protein
MHLKSVQIREVVFGGNDLIRGVVSLEGDSVVVFYYHSLSEIWPDKRGNLIIKGSLYCNKLRTIPSLVLVISRDESFPLISELPFFFSKIFGNKMCQPWSNS